jgi:hypothetical protein
MMQTHFAGGADIHGRTQADGFEAAEHFDGFCVVLMAPRAFAGYRFFFFVTHWPLISWRTKIVEQCLKSGRSPNRHRLEARLAEGFAHRPVQPRNFPRLTPYSLILGAGTGTRRVPASSHPARRDAAKTIPLSASSRSEQVRYSRLAAIAAGHALRQASAEEPREQPSWRTSSKNCFGACRFKGDFCESTTSEL